MLSDSTPQIYVACLAAYNDGCLHGKWIDANQDPEDINAEIKEMLKASPIKGAEEWAIHDTNNFDQINIHEYASIETVAEIARCLEEYGPAFASFYNDSCIDEPIDDIEEKFQDSYIGEYDSERAYAEEYAHECLDIPERLENYIDYDAIANDLFMDSLFSAKAPNFNIYVFRRY
jgi:antirestriction protein